MSDRKNNFLWTIHTTIVDKSIKPGTPEDKRFLALALCGEVGELSNLVKKSWRGDADPRFNEKLEEETGDIYAYMQLLCCACDVEFRNEKPHYTLVGGTADEQMRFLALSLNVTAGKLVELLELEWLGQGDIDINSSAFRYRIEIAVQEFYTQLKTFAAARGWELDAIMNKIILPKIRARWG